MKIGIVGLGLIGGSMAKSIKARTSHEVYGIDIDSETMMFARLCGAIDGTLDVERLSQCDLILLAVRPGIAVQWVKENAHNIRAWAVLCDLCGIKRKVTEEIRPIAKANNFVYIGGHPMAGREVGGFVNSRVDLFDGAFMILTPDGHTDVRILERLRNLFIDIGFASLTFSTPDEHDRIIAFTSQLAHVVSNAYIKSPEAERRRGFSAGSYKDMTRVARLDEDMWSELMIGNADYLSEQLRILIDNLNKYLSALERRDEDELRALLREGRIKKAEAGGN